MIVKVKMTPVLRAVSLALLVLSNLAFLWNGIHFVHFVVHPIFNQPSLAG